jgi:hypothetical protein
MSYRWQDDSASAGSNRYIVTWAMKTVGLAHLLEVSGLRGKGKREKGLTKVTESQFFSFPLSVASSPPTPVDSLYQTLIVILR